ncbi:MAG: hypothetical protein LBR34_03555 [Prevotella sp.]|jgi:hypothetical protein|nr:hypothetical protein [Prevotella sp.]
MMIDDVFEIDYFHVKTTRRNIVLAVLLYAAVVGLAGIFQHLLTGVLDAWFYVFAGLVLLSAAALLALTLFKPAPLIYVTGETMRFGIDRKISYRWENIKEVSIGISSLKIELTGAGGGKTGYIDLGKIKYNDIKALKSRIIEICEHRKIPFRNSYYTEDGNG